MKKFLGVLVRLSFAVISVAASVSATDYHVDAVRGDDTGGDGTALSPWRTITHALAAIPALPSVPHTILVGPGTYDAALGETFPLAPRPKIRIVGTEGAQDTILEAPGQRVLWYQASYDLRFDASSGASGLTLRNAVQGISLEGSSMWSSMSPSFTDLVIENMSGSGVFAAANGYSYLYTGHVGPKLTRVTIANCAEGIGIGVLGSQFMPSTARMELSDCTIRDCAADGIRASVHGRGRLGLELQRCRILDNAGHGVVASTALGHIEDSHMSLSLSSTLIAGNAASGVFLDVGGRRAIGALETTYCTFAHNLECGILVSTNSSAFETSIMNSVLCGNAADLSAPSLFARSSNSADGALLGQPDCIAVDAQFVAPADGDYRLRFGSPCVDSADAAYGDVADLVGRSRMIDGNLDTIAVPDMGAMEFATLDSTGFEPGSTRLLLEIRGPGDGRAILYLSHAPLLGSPMTTPFGSFFLVRGTAVQVPTARIQSRTSNLIELKVPGAPGSTVALQALIRSHAAPAGRAFSNPLVFQIAP